MRFTWVHNPPAGLSPEGLIGKTDAEILPPEAAETIMAAKRKTMETGKAQELETNFELFGRKRSFYLMIEALRDEHDQRARHHVGRRRHQRAQGQRGPAPPPAARADPSLQESARRDSRHRAADRLAHALDRRLPRPLQRAARRHRLLPRPSHRRRLARRVLAHAGRAATGRRMPIASATDRHRRRGRHAEARGRAESRACAARARRQRAEIRLAVRRRTAMSASTGNSARKPPS